MSNLNKSLKAAWQIELQEVITDPSELLKALQLDLSLLNKVNPALKSFPLRVTRSFLNRMQPQNPNDPLLLQVLPWHLEQVAAEDYSFDPLIENQTAAVPGLLHKYRDRALLTVTGSCAIHCRYCFRRHFPYTENNPNVNGWERALNYLSQHTEIHELILSGGDPLTLKDSMLAELINKLNNIRHLKRLRIHSRLPIVLPNRITPDLIKALTASHLKTVMIVHANHANEIDDSVKTASTLMRAHNIPVFNQAVLLKGINDTAQAQINLSEVLLAAGIIPYYLHMLDKVAGAAHFAVSEDAARKIIQEMLQQCSGYLVPRLVREIPGAGSKIPVTIF